MAEGAAPIKLGVADGDEIKLEPIRCNPVLLPVFLLYLVWAQAVSALALFLLLFGIVINHGTICRHLCSILCTKYRTTVGSSEVLDDTKEPVFYLSNHRSWGDFWMDGALLGGPSSVGRWLVMVVIPFTGLWGWTQGWSWFFSRGVKRPEGTVNWTIDFYKRSHSNWAGKGLIVYPEGTRSRLPWGNALKHGGLAVAHSMGWPVQCIITTNKERMLLEGKGHVGFGVACVTAVSPPIRPASFETTNDFIAEVEKVWRSTWKAAYTEDSVPREDCKLPGVVQQPGAGPFPGTASLNVLRFLVFAALGALAYNSREGAEL